MPPIFIIPPKKIFHFTCFYYTFSITRTCLKAQSSRKMHSVLPFKFGSSHLWVLIIHRLHWSFHFYFWPPKEEEKWDDIFALRCKKKKKKKNCQLHCYIKANMVLIAYKDHLLNEEGAESQQNFLYCTQAKTL